MSSNRFKPGNFTAVNIPASRGLMNTDEAPQAMPLTDAQDIENMIPTRSRTLSKRNGLAPLSTTGITAGEHIVWLHPYLQADGTFVLVAGTDAGKIYSSNTALDTWTSRKTGLDTAGTIRGCDFNDKVVIVNGVDTPMVFDGSTVEPIVDWVQDNGSTFTKVDADTFSLVPFGNYENTKYPASQTVRITMDGGATVVTATVLSSSYVGGVTEVNLTTSALTGATIDKIEYQDSPPAFSFIYAAHDRLWALGSGEIKANDYRNAADRMFVYYTDGTNSETSWFKQSGATAQEIPYINIADKHKIADELVGIGQYDQYTVFFGRKMSQVWSGTNPLVSGDMAWVKTVAVGCLHGGLIQELETDLVFYSQDGVRNMRRAATSDELTLNQEVGSKVQEMVQRQIKRFTQTDAIYKNGHSFVYPQGGFYGFNLKDQSHVYFIDEKASGWVRFTGLFGKATAAATGFDGRLYLAVENDVYIYGDKEGVYGDNSSPIQTSWFTAWIQPKSASRWANKYIELEVEEGTDEELTIRRYQDNDYATYAERTITTKSGASYFDESFWDVAEWDSVGENKLSRVEDRFIAYNTSFAVQSYTTTNIGDIISMKLFGKVER